MMDRRSQSLRFSTTNVALRAAFGAGLVVAALAWDGDAHAQATARYPFPSSNTSGLRTGALTTHELRAQYEFWKQEHLQDCNGSMRVVYPENPGEDTRSEGVGYGMVISAFMGDKATFDGLFAYWQRFDNNNNLLMNWRTFDCGNNSEAGSASDADVDAALGLIVADIQWGGYATFANNILNSIRQIEMLACNGRDLLDPGSDGAFGSCGCLNPSYFAPGYYPAYAQYNTANSALWTKAVADSYATFGNIQNAQTGLVPAWSSAASAQTQNCSFQVAGGGNPNEYQSDAARVPWRVATDLAWNGSTSARTFLTRMLGWLNTENRITHVVDRFTTGGSALPTFNPNAGPENDQPLNNMTLDATGRRSTITMGAFATAGLAGTQAELDRLVGAWQSLYRAGDNLGPMGIDQAHAFNNSLALLYGMLATGTMWNPLGDDPTPLIEPELQEQPGNILVNGDFDEGILGWTMENLGGTAAEGYAIHEAGELHVLLQKITGIATQQYMVRLKQRVMLQANQNYRITLRARASEPRLMRAFVGQRDMPYATYVALDDDPETMGDGINLTSTMQTFDLVFAAPATSGFVQLALDFADSLADVYVDDVSIAPTADPVTAPGETIVNPTTPGTPDPTPAGGTPTGMNGTIGTVNPTGDSPGTPGVAPGAPDPNGSTAGMPPPPAVAPGAASCTAATQQTCAPALCSVPLGLCYDQNTGYVWDPTAMRYTQPPRGVQGCAPDQVYWPKFGLCYIPETGFMYDPQDMRWEFYGLNYTQDERPPADDSSCSIGAAPGGGASSRWLLVGLLGAALGLTYRRRSA